MHTHNIIIIYGAHAGMENQYRNPWIAIYYTIYNEKYFQKVSFCVITHPIGQNGRAVCKKYGNHGDARGAAVQLPGYSLASLALISL